MHVGLQYVSVFMCNARIVLTEVFGWSIPRPGSPTNCLNKLFIVSEFTFCYLFYL
jgi:hypothetical protein